MNNQVAYPNPQFIRRQWYDLNGQWDFYLGSNESDTISPPAASCFNSRINVPYSYPFTASGIANSGFYPVVWYRRHFQCTVSDHQTCLLHFEAVDYECDLWLNGHHLGHHCGGHIPFTIEISSLLQADNELIVGVKAFQPTDQAVKSSQKPSDNFHHWYSRTIGIWQNVWLEVTGQTYIDRLTMIPHLSPANLHLNLILNNEYPATVTAAISYHGQHLTTGHGQAKHGRVNFDLDLSNYHCHYWSPSSPALYDIDFTVTADNQECDHVTSYFGIRQIQSQGHQILLNHQPLYQKLVLNQGYYPTKGLTGSPEDYQNDLTKLKAMGFNGTRLHQHVASHRMLYLCDKLGVLAWAEFPSLYAFSSTTMTHVVDALPSFIGKHINHPSVITYVLMNRHRHQTTSNPEQAAFVDSLYHIIKAYDGSRLVISNNSDGQAGTDLCAIADNSQLSQNADPINSADDGANLPLIISQYFSTTERHADDYTQQLQCLTADVKSITDCCGFCYSQLTNVGTESNGLLDCNHQYKFNPQAVRKMVGNSQLELN